MSYPGYPGYPSQPAGYPSATSYPMNPSQPNIGFNVAQNPGCPSPYPGSAQYATSSVPTYPPNLTMTSGYPSYPSGAASYPSMQQPYPTAAAAGYPAASGYAPSMAPQHYVATAPAGTSYAGSYPGQVALYQTPISASGHNPYPNMPTTNPYNTAAAAQYGVPGTAPSAALPGLQQPWTHPSTTMASSYFQGTPTVKEHHPFDPNQDAQMLRKAMKGFGTDEAAIIAILTKRVNAQRQQIIVHYKSLFGKDLIQNLKSELSGNFEDVIIGLMTPLYDYQAIQLFRAMSGLGTKEKVVIDIMCSNSNREIREINASYLRLHGRPLERDLASDTSGYFSRLLISLSTGNRSESTAVDYGRAVADAQALRQAGVAKWGTNETTFISILATQSFDQLRAVFSEYDKLTGRTIEYAIQSEMSGDLKDGLLAVVKCIRNKHAYFAERLHQAMQGLGTNENTLVRIFVTRCELDLADIRNEYQRNYGKSLAASLSQEVSGDFKRALLGLLG